MKKGVLIILLTVTCGIAKAQRNQQIAWPVDPVTGRITFTASVYVTDAPANQLLHTAEQYVAKNFNTTLDSIIYIDERSRKIAAQGGFLTNVEFLGENGKGRIQYTFTISCIKQSVQIHLHQL